MCRDVVVAKVEATLRASYSTVCDVWCVVRGSRVQ
jgi:hypothetical protein